MQFSLSLSLSLTFFHTRMQNKRIHERAIVSSMHFVTLSFVNKHMEIRIIFLVLRCFVSSTFDTHVVLFMFWGRRWIRCIWQRTPCGGAMPQSRQGRTKPLRHEALFFGPCSATLSRLSANNRFFFFQLFVTFPRSPLSSFCPSSRFSPRCFPFSFLSLCFSSVLFCFIRPVTSRIRSTDRKKNFEQLGSRRLTLA